MESDLPSTLDNSTIYAITDSGETEIEKLIIRGMEFAGGGGTPSTEPKIVLPIGTQIDFNGASTKTVTVRALNLSEALTIAVTGVTANLQTISANDAANGVQLTLTKGQNFVTGTLRIYSSEVDKSWTVSDSQEYQAIAAVKLTGTQWLQTDYQPNPNTEFELDMKLETNANTDIRQGLSSGIGSYILQCNLLNDNTFYVNTAGNEGTTSYRFLFRNTTASQAVQQLDFSSNQSAMLQRSILSYKKSGSSMIMSFNGVSATLPVKQGTVGILNIGYIDSSYHVPLNRWNLYIYSFKIIENGVVVRNYSPVIKNGVPGLYDDVTHTFISSMSQTDEVVPIYDN